MACLPVDHGKVSVPCLLDVDVHQRRDIHRLGKDGGMAVRTALPCDKAEKSVGADLYRLAGGEILRHQDKGIRCIQGAFLLAGEDKQKPVGDVLYVGAARLKIRILHILKPVPKLLPDTVDGIFRRFLLFENGADDRLMELPVAEHHAVHFEDLGLLRADLRRCLFLQKTKLFHGGLVGHLITGKLRFRVVRDGILDDILFMLIKPDDTDRDFRRNGLSCNCLHGLHSCLLFWFLF